jgi:hypothetical protein
MAACLSTSLSYGPVSGHVTFELSIYQLMDIQVVSTFGLLSIILLWTLVYKAILFWWGWGLNSGLHLQSRLSTASVLTIILGGWKYQPHFIQEESQETLGMVAHFCNPSYLEGRGQKDCVVRGQTRQKVSETPISTNKLGMVVHLSFQLLGRQR